MRLPSLLTVSSTLIQPYSDTNFLKTPHENKSLFLEKYIVFKSNFYRHLYFGTEIFLSEDGVTKLVIQKVIIFPGKPRITKSLVDMTVDAGKTLKLDVEVEGCPEPKVKWFKDGKEVSTDARIKIDRDTQRYLGNMLA